MIEQLEQQVYVQFAPFSFLEKAVEDAGGFCFDHLDDLEGEFELAFVRVVGLRRDGEVGDGFGDKGGRIGDIV